MSTGLLSSQKTEILYLAKNRLEFTKKSFSTMIKNTTWKSVTKVVVYDDGSEDGTREYLSSAVKDIPVPYEMNFSNFGSPVGIMNDYVIKCGVDKNDTVFAKIDNDVMLPPKWLDDGIRLVFRNPEVDFFGIEAFHRQRDVREREVVLTPHIGGIGFMRTRAFTDCLPRPLGRFGFTNWQIKHSNIKKVWINPALFVNLLNRVPIEPWKSLSLQYESKGWQRKEMGGFLPIEEHAQWDWWQ